MFKKKRGKGGAAWTSQDEELIESEERRSKRGRGERRTGRRK